jgi:predicted transposase YbfD/YdcC
MLTTFLIDLKDFRRGQGQRYELHNVILFSILAISCNAKTFRQIAIFIQSHFLELSHAFDLEWKRSPSYTTIRNHINGLDGADIEGAFRVYTQHILPMLWQQDRFRHICVDGKTLCGSVDKAQSKRAIQKLSLFDTVHNLILAHVEIDDKTNEIPAFQQLLQEVEIPNAMYSADAMHCQKKTFEIAVDKAGLLIQVKGNQAGLEEDLAQVVKLEKSSDSYIANIDYGHGRIAKRSCQTYSTGITDHIVDPQWAEYIKTVIRIQRNVETKDTKSGEWVKTEEIAIYVSNKLLSAEQAHHLVKNHWGIENTNHYVRDVSLMEDANKIRTKPFNFSVLRSFVLNIFRRNNLRNIKDRLYEFSQDWTKLYSYPQVI